MKRKRTVVTTAVVLAAIAIVLVALDAFGRPGGGGSFSGGSRGGGGGGFGGGGGAGGAGAGILLQVIFSILPWPLKLIIILGFLVYFAWGSISGSRRTDWSTMGAARPVYVPSDAPPSPMHQGPRATIARLRSSDPKFSLVLFEDFLYALYAEAHHRRAQGELDLLSAYLAPNVIAQMNQAPREPIQGVVIGALRYIGAYVPTGGAETRVRIDVELEVNLTVQSASGPKSAYLVERWTLSRSPNAKSPPPEKTRIFGCPNCGAPQSAVMAGRCNHCNQAVSTGEFGWVVVNADVVRYEPRPPLLTTEVEEQGTDLPTVIDPGAEAALRALWRRDQAFQWPQFEQRVALIFRTFQVAWSNRDLAAMRPFLSDNLLQIQTYWVDAYKLQKLRNVSENATIQRIVLARVESDASFDAITARVYASSLDYTVTDEGKLVTGSRSKPRAYTEYWTLIRGASRTGPTKTEPVCPNCGAPLEINMAGTCKYCQAKVTTGEFDWVLSRIEQDEVYEG